LWCPRGVASKTCASRGSVVSGGTLGYRHTKPRRRSAGAAAGVGVGVWAEQRPSAGHLARAAGSASRARPQAGPPTAARSRGNRPPPRFAEPWTPWTSPHVLQAVHRDGLGSHDLPMPIIKQAHATTRTELTLVDPPWSSKSSPTPLKRLFPSLTPSGPATGQTDRGACSVDIQVSDLLSWTGAEIR
jgi:hypothetical protein